jgi:type IV secretion system protein VirB9
MTRSGMKYALIVAALCVQPSHAATLPTPAVGDARISYVQYNKDDVTVIEVQRGTVTRIVLATDERIEKDASAAGFPADCAKSDLEWCIHAVPGTNQVLVKPKDGATHNNLELRTNLRDYSFSFKVLPDAGAAPPTKLTAASASHSPMYRVVFSYPTRATGAVAATALTRLTAIADRLSGPVNSRLVTRPVAKNWKYSMQPAAGSDDIVPSLVFDDGRFTYFRFPANREVPTIFAISPQGEESRVNFHIDAVDSSLLAVQRMGRRFVLRLGTSAVGIWNDAFDKDGSPAVDGTTAAGVKRVIREGQ